MKSIKKAVSLSLSSEVCFHKFVNELGKWWPKEYSWSQDKLQSISIEARKDGLCTEIGHMAFVLTGGE